jgi:hypothetical protein
VMISQIGPIWPAARGTGISVPSYLCTSRFVWANSIKPEVFGTYQKIPGTASVQTCRCVMMIQSRSGQGKGSSAEGSSQGIRTSGEGATK